MFYSYIGLKESWKMFLKTGCRTDHKVVNMVTILNKPLESFRRTIK